MGSAASLISPSTTDSITSTMSIHEYLLSSAASLISTLDVNRPPPPFNPLPPLGATHLPQFDDEQMTSLSTTSTTQSVEKTQSDSKERVSKEESGDDSDVSEEFGAYGGQAKHEASSSEMTVSTTSSETKPLIKSG